MSIRAQRLKKSMKFVHYAKRPDIIRSFYIHPYGNPCARIASVPKGMMVMRAKRLKAPSSA